MEEKKVRCPGCGAVLEVRNSRSEAVKRITCPNCGMALQVTFPANLLPEAPTYYPPNEAPNVPVSKGDVPVGVAKTGERPALLYEGQRYSLHNGRNVVGRRAASSQATVQIPTDDRYMSRQHVVVEIGKTPRGHVKALLTNCNNKNATHVNGLPVENEDEVALQNEYEIRMGDTTVTYVCC